MPRNHDETAFSQPAAKDILGDAAAVIQLRVAKIARGGAAGKREAKLMVSEKVRAALHIQRALVTGRLGCLPGKVAKATFAYYAGKIRANRRRLEGSA